jgi:hypothetical protein
MRGNQLLTIGITIDMAEIVSSAFYSPNDVEDLIIEAAFSNNGAIYISQPQNNTP